MSDEPLATERPDRDEYPERSLSDLVTVIERALADDGWAHHRAGRYTAHRTHTEHEPDARPGCKHVTIRVTECERDIILNVPEEHADSVLAVFKSAINPQEDER
jgi:hypothetical protein